MRLTMAERRVVTKATCERYRKATRKAKGLILDEFTATTGYCRCYARWLLRNHGRQVEIRPGIRVEGDARARSRRRVKRIYGEDVLAALKKLWVMLDYISGKRLKPALAGLIERLEAFKEIRLTKAVRTQLLNISAATIDRLLAHERAKFKLKGRRHTKPGSLLKHQIPIRTYSDWDDARPGFLEMDLVGHEGGSACGDYCFTLDVTDVASGWSEQAAVLNKAQIHVFDALLDIRQRLPIAVLGLHSDNGSEFINAHMRRFCTRERITFTRTRPYRKNDNAHIEQKNWSIVRRFVGYGRYESLQACQTLNELYRLLGDYNNYFLPSLKLKEKSFDGAHTLRRYHPAQTPYQRLLQSPDVAPAVKELLQAHYMTINPAQLHLRIVILQKKLLKLTARVPQSTKAAA
jgi:transposase InsO family protein